MVLPVCSATGVSSEWQGQSISHPDKQNYHLQCWTLFGGSPVIRRTQPSEHIRIEQLDKLGQVPIDVAVTGTLVDLAKIGVRLEPGGLYTISNGSARHVIKFSVLAEPDVPLLSRFLPM